MTISHSNETAFHDEDCHNSPNGHQINCAGIEGVRPLLDVDMEWAKQVYDVNVWGPLAITQAFAPLVIKSKGIIANFSSIGCKIPMCWAGTTSQNFPRTGRTVRANLVTRYLFQLKGCNSPDIGYAADRDGAARCTCRDGDGRVGQYNHI